MKIGILLDTNVLFSKEQNFTEATFIKKLEDITSEIESTDTYEKLYLLLPQIVIDELFHKQVAYYYETIQKIKNAIFPNSTFTVIDEYAKYLEPIYQKAISDFQKGLVKAIILPYPASSKLNKIIERSVKKRPPFEGKDKQSDKGFKDTIIWETLIEFKENNLTETIVLYSNDDRICCDELKNEYENTFRDILHMVRRTESNTHILLFNKIAEVLEEEITPSFATMLENQLESRLRDCIDWLFGDSTYENNNKTYIYNGSEIHSIKIRSIEDKLIDNRIKYIVDADIMCNFVCEGDSGYETTQTLDKHEFIIYYHLKDDNFYIKEFDDAGMGRATFYSDTVEL